MHPVSDSHAHAQASLDAAERELLAARERCDESTFVRFVDAQHGALVRFAGLYVRDAAAAEELAQEAWGAFVEGLPQLPERARPKTQLFRALLACATRGVSLAASADAHGGAVPSVDASRFMTDGVWAGGWAAPPCSFGVEIEQSLRSGPLQQQLLAALDRLPAAQREVVLLRDVEGFSAEEVCDLLGVSEPRQRRLLHLGRAGLRGAIELHLMGAT